MRSRRYRQLLAALSLCVLVPTDSLDSATMPLETIDDRSIYITRTDGKSSAKGGGDDQFVWRPWADIPYAQHVAIEFYGAYISSAADPNAIRIVANEANLFERTSLLGQSFPLQSGACFTFESYSASGQPVSYTGYVNVVLQFYDNTNPLLTDVVTFLNLPLGTWQSMKVVRDTLAGPSVNFAYASPFRTNIRTSTVNSYGTACISRLNGVTNLTANGSGTWGVVSAP